MGTEIERKFRIDHNKLLQETGALREGRHIAQGYLSKDPAVRVRIQGHPLGKFFPSPATVADKAWITIKGPGLQKRQEFEYSIPLEDSTSLMNLCAIRLSKIRFVIEHGYSTWEVDQFLGQHEGLWLAEIELKTEDQPFKTPSWIGQEVTDDHRYQNVYLAEHPEDRFWSET